MKNQILKKIYRAVVYLRLSDEDGDNRESDSISNQRILIHSFLKSHPEIQVVKECVDDGYTGTNFNRPGFQEMLRMLEEGEADCIIVKDLSRYGRDFSGVLQYVERILPKMGVRLILVNDNYDSLTPNRDFLTLRFKSLINDLYPADTSKSVRSHLYVKMTAGQCVAPFAFYGYLKSEEDKHKLVMDEVAASVVRDIYHMKMQGYSLTDISEELNRRGILTPLRYKQVYLKQKLKTGFRLTEKPVWMPTMVRRILLDERYTGVLIQGKTTTPNHKVKVVIHKEEAEWIRYENAFEPVINRHQYEVVGNLMKMDTMRGAKGLALLSGLVKCGDCKESMVLKSPDKVHHYYVCSTSLYEKQCSSHSISEKKLVGAVTEAILHYISVLVELKEILAYVKTASIPRQRLLEEDKKLEMLEKESQRILNIKVKLYDSFAEEILDRTEFETFKAKYDQSLEEIRQAMECQQREIRNLQETLEKQQEWLEYFLEYRDRTEVDRLMLVNLVKRIEVYEQKRIIIHFWFEDEFEKVLGLLETVNRTKPDQRVEAFLKGKGRKQVPKVSKRGQKRQNSKPEVKYLRTYIYVRLSEKDGGHGRRDSIYIQKQICEDYAKKHPEMLVVKVYADNGVTGTTFQRDAFEELMEDVANKKVDCIIVKDFARFGRDALDAVDLIDVIFPTLNIRFISVMDEYDSANPACVENRTTNILKHFMNDYYAREVSEKLVQAHRLSRERGEFWGSRPPYGYQRAEENSKKLVPEPEEAEIIRQIFYWYVFEEMSSYDIARELNGKKVLGPEDSYQKRKQGKEPEKRRLWRSDGIRKILQNPVYIGAAVYGKTKQMLAQNIPLQMIPKEQWEVCENAWEAVVERAIYEKAQEIAKERWKDTLDNWAANPKEKQGADGPFKGRIFCGHCGRRLGRSRSGGNEKHKYMVYKCPSFSLTDHTECFRTVNEIYINQAVKAALRYQIQLAVESKKTYGAEFYQKLEQEVAEKIKNARQKYEKYGRKLETLFEHYATGLLDCKEYQEIKSIYQEEQQAARQNMKQIQLRGQHLLDQVKARMDWTEELLKYQRFQKIEKGIADRFIEKITVYSKDYVEIVFWFGDLFEKELEKELDNMEGGLPYAV